MTAAVTPVSVTLSRHPLAVRRQVARRLGRPVVQVVGPRRQVRGVPAVPAADTQVGAARLAVKRAVHEAPQAVLHTALQAIHVRLRPIHVVPRTGEIIQAATIQNALLSATRMRHFAVIQPGAIEMLPLGLTGMHPLAAIEVHHRVMTGLLVRGRSAARGLSAAGRLAPSVPVRPVTSVLT
jgi:hypothetical protein